MFVVCVYRPLTNSSFVSICVLFFLRFLYFLLCFIYFGKQCQSLSTLYRSNSICIHEMCASIGHIFSAIFRVCCMAATSVVKFRVFFFRSLLLSDDAWPWLTDFSFLCCCCYSPILLGLVISLAVTFSILKVWSSMVGILVFS